MNTPLDESLHSFLIRHQFAYTHKFDPKGVISSNGGWRRIPYAHHEVTRLFEKYDDLFLLEAIDVDIQLDELNHQFFDEPDSYCLSIHMTFFQGFQNQYVSNGQLPIVYCPDCIKDMIRENGFGYFRKNWGRENWCDNHDIALHHLESNNYRSSVKLLKKLLLGESIGSKVIKGASPKKRKAIDEDIEHSPLKLFFPVRTVECSARRIGLCLAENWSELLGMNLPIEPDELLILIRWLVYSSSDSHEFFKAKINLGRLIAIFQKFLPLVDLFNNDFSYVRLCVGARSELSEIVLVPKDRDCLSCDNKKCVAQMNGAKEIENIDFSYLVHNSTSLRRLSFQQMHLPRTGPNLWSPIQIKNWIEVDKLAKAECIEINTGSVSQQ